MKYLKYVNVKQGTKSNPRYSNGNTLPLTQVPFGMLALAPQSDGGERSAENAWWYDPEARYCEGIRLTHQPSPWIGDYGALLITPQSDVVSDTAAEAWSGIRPEDCELSPDYIRMKFLRSNATAEATAGERCFGMRIQFDTYCDKYISLFNICGKMEIKIDEEKNCIYGMTNGFTSGKAENFGMYFVIIPKGEWLDCDRSRTVYGDKGCEALHLAIKNDCNSAEFDAAISYISYEQALINYSEIKGKDFDTIRNECASKWESFLSKIEIDTDSVEDKKTFYSCLYRCGLFPNTAYENQADGSAVHYSPYTGKVHKGKRYTDNGFWDTYRTEFPLFTLIDRSLYSDIIEGVLNDYREGGWLPRWVSPGEVGCMPSTLIDSVIAQAAVCGILTREQMGEALQAMIHHANNKSDDERFGRNGIEEYNELGYVPYDMYKESVNLTLDFAYGDYCISRVAAAVGNEEAEKEYLKRSARYANIFDKESGFMHARDKTGKFREPFDPYMWGNDYTEASAWQTTFSVQHDLEGLAALMGGREQLLSRLDDVFNQKPFYRVGGYDREIHEMTEMAAVDFGLCEMNNQPGFLIPYIYAYFGEEKKTEYWVNKICSELFTYKADGFPGDEDNGSMAAWYVLSCLGIYPICPADNKWIKLPSMYKGKLCGTDIEEYKEKML